MLVIMIRSLVNPMKFSFENFSTTGVTSSDGALPNRKYFE